MAAAESGKRVSWVELYVDLVFVLAVSQLAEVIVHEPEMHSVWVRRLGLFVALWWTWIGFAVLYNRLGADVPHERLLFLAGSVPVGVAAVAVAPASVGDSTAFALSLAAARIVLAVAHVITGQGREALRRRIVQAMLGSAALFTVSVWVPEPWRYVLWGIAIGGESSALLHEDRRAAMLRDGGRRDRQHRVDVGLDRQPRPAAGPLQRVQGRGDPPQQSRWRWSGRRAASGSTRSPPATRPRP